MSRSEAVKTAQEVFIHQYTQHLCIEWAKQSVTCGGLLPEGEFTDEAIAACPYKTWAMKKGWIGKRSPRTLTKSGWGRAIAVLKR